MKIPFVRPEDYGRLEGKIDEMGWILAKLEFEKRLPGMYGSLWDAIQRKFGCYPQNDPVLWANGMNRIIDILNGLSGSASKEEFVNAFQV